MNRIFISRIRAVYLFFIVVISININQISYQEKLRVNCWRWVRCFPIWDPSTSTSLSVIWSHLKTLNYRQNRIFISRIRAVYLFFAIFFSININQIRYQMKSRVNCWRWMRCFPICDPNTSTPLSVMSLHLNTLEYRQNRTKNIYFNNRNSLSILFNVHFH